MHDPQEDAFHMCTNWGVIGGADGPLEPRRGKTYSSWTTAYTPVTLSSDGVYDGQPMRFLINMAWLPAGHQ